MNRIATMVATTTLSVVVLGATAQAEQLSYYVGVDGLASIAGTGTYGGLANPNHNHLTLLYAHFNATTPSSNHYHSKATWIYTGPNLGAGTAVTNSTSNYVPEGANPPIQLSAGTGLYEGKLVTNPYTNSADPVHHFSFLTLGSTQSLSGFATGSGEHFMFNSSGGRWTGGFQAADLHWELVGLTPGLNVGDASNLNIVTDPGDDLHLASGTENDDFEFTPVLWTDAAAAPGTYEARFKLVDETGTFGDSGTVRILVNVAAVPEPGTIGLLGMLATGALARRHRRPGGSGTV